MTRQPSTCHGGSSRARRPTRRRRCRRTSAPRSVRRCSRGRTDRRARRGRSRAVGPTSRARGCRAGRGSAPSPSSRATPSAPARSTSRARRSTPSACRRRAIASLQPPGGTGHDRDPRALPPRPVHPLQRAPAGDLTSCLSARQRARHPVRDPRRRPAGSRPRDGPSPSRTGHRSASTGRSTRTRRSCRGRMRRRPSPMRPAPWSRCVPPTTTSAPAATSCRASVRWSPVGHRMSSTPQCRKTTTVSELRRARRTARRRRGTSFAEARPGFPGRRPGGDQVVVEHLGGAKDIRCPFTVRRNGA